MGFSAKQLAALRRDPDQSSIRTREVNGRELSYLEGWFSISEANRIFGFDGWNRETMESRCVLARENRGSFTAVYVARIRITVHKNGTTVIREGHGTGEGRGDSPGLVHDIAFKAAETDATKRALATFGRPFGLALYSNGRTGISAPVAAPKAKTAEQVARFARDDTTPIPRPSRYYGRRQDPISRELSLATRTAIKPSQPSRSIQADAASIVPQEADLEPLKIDKSVLTFSEPKRRRDKEHLKYIRTKPCLVCGRQPSDPHHLKFAQPRALGLKVSDEFTVPLCRGHHRQLHQAGNELGWWEALKIDALAIAKELWDESHAKTPSLTYVSQGDDHNAPPEANTGMSPTHTLED